MELAGEWLALVVAAEIAPGTSRPFELAGHSLLVCRAGGEWFTVENRCPHTSAALTGGRVRGDCIVCPVHGARFRLRDGKHLTPPASCGLRTFATRVVDGWLQVRPVPIDPPGGVPSAAPV